MATDEKLHQADGDTPLVWAPLHAIQVLGELEAAEAVQPLLTLLDQDDDWLDKYLPAALGRIGQPALGPLRDELFTASPEAFRTGPSSDGSGCRGGAPPGAAGASGRDAGWAPRPRVVARTADETINGYVIGHLVDLKTEEALPAIERAYREDRVDQSFIGLDRVRESFGLEVPPASPPVGICLDLRCTACRYTRRHDVAKIYYDLGTVDRQKNGQSTRYDPWIIPQRIICPKCGAVNQYELDGLAHLVLAAELLKRTALRHARLTSTTRTSRCR